MKKQIRKMTNRTAGYIFFYNLIMIAVMFGAIVIMTIAAMAGAGAEQAADRAEWKQPLLRQEEAIT